MKKNLLGFISSLLGISSFFFLSTPFLKYIRNNSVTEYSIGYLLGLPQKVDGYGYYSYSFSLMGILLFASMFLSLVCLIVVVTSILDNKKRSPLLFAMSTMHLFTIYFVAKYISITIKNTSSSSYESYYYTIGWGIIIVFILLGAAFILMAVQFISDIVSSKKSSVNSKYDEIYKYKKLLDDGIITQEDYDLKKKEFLENVSK